MHPKQKKQRKKLEQQPIPVDVICSQCGDSGAVDYNEVLEHVVEAGLIPPDEGLTKDERRAKRQQLYLLRQRGPAALREEIERMGFVCPGCFNDRENDHAVPSAFLEY